MAPWPGGAPFALFLSHDIDHVHDREMWRILADLNHIRRMILKGEGKRARMATARVGRAILNPKPPLRAFDAILRAEAQFGFKSTFFLLHDHYWARHGARYRLGDRVVREVVDLIVSAGCELGLHGGYYKINDTDAYRASRDVIAREFGIAPVGVRNHYLRLDGERTWRAQADAGFNYDSTFGHRDQLGPKEGRVRPFWVGAPPGCDHRGLVELPLSLMDVALFRCAGFDGEQALDAAWQAIGPVIAGGGLVTLLWHNTYFDEPEYWDWQWVYERLLERLAALNPWCATGAEIDQWWRKWQEGRAKASGQPGPPSA
ncbi:MAG: hypothetical protein KA072_05405 [Thermoanaerobaculaceae bacterium]|nr:hypothetical protein [Thermoanaerobaculaceae bacterium]MDI9622848.1 hypothetical protein [Acidobacteriota bacterium]NLH12486.1 hypothetical protein [Holophagae bacterium]